MIQKTYLKTKKVCKVKFVYNDNLAKKVDVYGLNGNWETPLPLTKKKDGTFAAEVNLPVDEPQRFKYFVNDSEWKNEPDADSESLNAFGTTDSVIKL